MKYLITIIIILSLPGMFFAWRSYSRARIGADAIGIGGAYVADASSEAAWVYNPAGAASIKEPLSVAYEAASRISVSDTYNWNWCFQFDYVPFAAVSGKVGDGRLGLSMETLFYSDVSWDNLSVRSLKASFAYPILPNLSVGAGVGPVMGWEGQSYSYSYFWNAGLLWKFDENIQAGLSFTSPIALDWQRAANASSVKETYPAIAEAGTALRVNDRLFFFSALEYSFIDSIRYELDGTNYSPNFDGNIFLRLHPHFGFRFLEEWTGAHLSFGFMADSSYYSGGGTPVYLLTAGVRVYGKDVTYRLAFIDSFLIGIFNPGNIREERILLSISFYPQPSP